MTPIEAERRRHLIQILRENGDTYEEIGKVFGITKERVRQVIHQVPKVRVIKSGENLLQGRDARREEIREYFDYTCQHCGRKWKEGERRLDVHHLSCLKEDSRKYDKDIDFNAVTLLCHKCHLNVPEHKRAMSEAYRPLR